MIKKLLLMLAITNFIFSGIALADISYTGSSTIGEKIIPEAAEAFTKKTGIKFGSIESPGSGKGIAAVLDGRAELAGVSRPLDIIEKRQKLYYQIIGYDAIGVYVNKSNPVTNLTREQLKGIFTGEIKKWMEVGGKDAPITCITETLEDKRATMAEFKELAMDGAAYREDRVETGKPADQVAMLAREENGIASVSVAFAREEIKAVSIDNILPDPRHVRSGAYLISRPLLLVTKGLPKGEVKEFIDFMLSSEGQRIVAKNFISLN